MSIMTKEDEQELERFLEEGDFVIQDNRVDQEGSWGKIWDDYDKVRAYMKENPDSTIYTIISGEDNTDWIWKGWHIVNRWGYMITRNNVEMDVYGIRLY